MIDHLRNLLDRERSRLFLWFPVGMGGGIIAYLSLSQEPEIWLTGALLGIILLLSMLVRRTSYGKLMGAIGLSIILGFAAIHAKTWYLTNVIGVAPLQHKLKGEFVGQVVDIEFMKDRQRYVIKLLEDGRMVRLSEKGKIKLSVGDKIQFRSTLLPFSRPVLEDGYDYGRAAFYKGLVATGRMTNVVIVEPSPPGYGHFHSLRSQLTQALFTAMPGESGAIAAALVTGERGRISEATRQAYADAGIAHVLAISGLHLSMIAGLVFMIFRRGLSLSMNLAERYDLKKLSSLVTFPFLMGYLLISGMGVPAVRSFIMVGIVLLGVIVDRQAISMRTLALAAITILLIQPENLLSASFALSFAAVMALIAAYEGGWTPLKNWGSRGGSWRWIVVYIVGIVASTVIATLATIPISLYIFNRISLHAIIGNLVAIPLMGFMIMPLLLIGVLTLPFGRFDGLFYSLDNTINLMTKVAYWTATLPGAAIQLAKPPEAFVWLMALGGLWLCFWCTKLRFWGMVPCVVAISLLFVSPAPFIWLSPEALIYWYDGKTMSTFANARHNDFFEEILLRQLGLKKIEVIVPDMVHFSLAETSVVLLNERFSTRQHGAACQNAHIIVSSRYVPANYEDHADIILDRSDLELRRGSVIQFGNSTRKVMTVQPQRSWTP